eukprot:5903456-Prymnesium_polylepis.1
MRRASAIEEAGVGEGGAGEGGVAFRQVCAQVLHGEGDDAEDIDEEVTRVGVQHGDRPRVAV